MHISYCLQLCTQYRVFSLLLGFIIIIFLYSASNRNEYQEYFLGVKAAGAQGSQPYHLQVPTVLKSGSLNLLEPSRPVQACYGIALPSPLPIIIFLCKMYFYICYLIYYIYR